MISSINQHYLLHNKYRIWNSILYQSILYRGCTMYLGYWWSVNLMIKTFFGGLMKDYYLMMLYLFNILIMSNNLSFFLVFDYCFIIWTFLNNRPPIIEKKWKRESILPREKGLTPWVNTKYVIVKFVCSWMLTVWRTWWVFLAVLFLFSPPWTLSLCL